MGIYNRRSFLARLSLAAGAVILPGIVSSCKSDETNSDSSLVSTEPVVTSIPTPTRKVRVIQRKGVWAWLRMFETKGDFGIPTSEVDYLDQLENIDVAMPLNGGKLGQDGNWLQEERKTSSTWATLLPTVAREMGQLYMPGVGNDRDGILAVLDSPNRQNRAAEDLVRLATADRYDAPWDGVYLDLEGIPFAYREKLMAFLLLLSNEIRRVGLKVGISIPGQYEDSGPNPEDYYTYDYSKVAECADFIDMRCYGYYKPRPRSIAPYWWMEACIEYALQKGIRADQLTLGAGNFSRYWPNSSQTASIEITYAQAQALLEQYGASSEWIEDNQIGKVRERYATIDTGHIWIHDEESYDYSLELIEKYHLFGNTMFSPGMGATKIWDTIKGWKNG